MVLVNSQLLICAMEVSSSNAVNVCAIYIRFTILCFEVDFIYSERYSLFI
jgi:hypothetical protein